VQDAVVHTSRGAVRGAVRDTGFLFGAIPYAAAPVRERRYRAPEPPEPWADIRDGSRLSRSLTQPARQLPGLRSEPLLGAAEAGEPELAVNVWTPDPGAGGLPVLVWLHGGAFVAGSPAIYDGSAWMRDGVVLVTVGYRLGIEGLVWFRGGDSNVALRDQLAALEWVREEIESFGGNPARVCVAGQSAGAMSLGWLLGSPRSRGLLGRAISMSGGLTLTYSHEQAERVAAAVAERAGVEPTAQAMSAVPLERIVEVQAAIAPGEIDLQTAEDRDPTGGMLWVAPVRDGDVVAHDPLAAIGAGAQVDLLAGDTSEEGLLYLAGVPGFDDFPEEALQAFAARLSVEPHELLAKLRASEPDAPPGKLAAQAITEVAFHAPTRALLERHASLGAGSTHAYRFAWRSPALGGRLGAAHAVDLPFVFDMLDAPGFSGADDTLLGEQGGSQELADHMHAAWVRFVETGDPGWPAYPEVEVFSAGAIPSAAER
jgi:para-nitrobenzyl esterase